MSYQVQPLTWEMIHKLVPLEATIEPKRWATGPATFDVERWLQQHGVTVERKKPWKSGTMYILAVCPWNQNHNDDDAYVIQQATGAIAAGCQHNGCADKDWHALRDALEPGWRDRQRTFEPAQPTRQPVITPDPEVDQLTTIGDDSVQVVLRTPTGPVSFVFSDMEKAKGALDSEISIEMLGHGIKRQPYSQRLNLLSMSARSDCRRELENVYGKEIGWAGLLLKACGLARDAFLGVDRAVLTAAITAEPALDFVIDDLVPANGSTIFFGAGSASKTYLTYSMALAVSRGLPWLGRLTQRRRVLVIDFETGKETYRFRMSRLAQGLGIPDGHLDEIYYWWANGVALPDHVDALKRSILKNRIGLLIIDHAAIACGAKPEESDAPTRFYRALTKLNLPAIIIAHVTGDGERDPAAVRRPFGSIFWSNGARRTWYVQRVDEEESDHIEVGIYCKKVNDGPKPAAFGIDVTFDGRAGPVHVEAAELRRSTALSKTRGPEYLIESVLTEAMPISDICDVLEAMGESLSSNSVRRLLNQHPNLFVCTNPNDRGKNHEGIWQRR